jgi:hypothetical protein
VMAEPPRQLVRQSTNGGDIDESMPLHWDI